jgi:hypothetical protein
MGGGLMGVGTQVDKNAPDLGQEVESFNTGMIDEVLTLALVSLGLTDFSRVHVLGVRYTSVTLEWERAWAHQVCEPTWTET